MSKGLNLGLEKLEAELKRHTPSKCLVHIFLTLLAPLTVIISGFAGTAPLSYLVLGADPSTHHTVQTQPWFKTISSPFACITPSLIPPLTQGYNSAQVNFQALVSICHFSYKFISKCLFVWCPEHSKTLVITDSLSLISHFRLPVPGRHLKLTQGDRPVLSGTWLYFSTYWLHIAQCLWFYKLCECPKKTNE